MPTTRLCPPEKKMHFRKRSLDGILLLCCSLAGCVPAEQTLFNEGEEQLKRAAYAEAYDTFTRYIALCPGTVPGYFDRALASRGLGRASKALEDLALVIHADPGDIDVRWVRYKILIDHRKELQDACGTVEPALRPMLEGLLTTEALLMLDDLERILNANSFDTGTRSARASLLWNLGRLYQARADLDTILTQAPDDVWALNARGMLLHDLGEYGASLEDYGAALDECDTCTYIIYNKALSLMASGRLHEAARTFGEFLAADSLDGEAWLMLAQCNIDLGLRDEACAALRKSIDLGLPDARERFDALCK